MKQATALTILMHVAAACAVSVVDADAAVLAETVIFTAEECAAIIAKTNAGVAAGTIVQEQAKLQGRDGPMRKPEVRDSTINWVTIGPDSGLVRYGRRAALLPFAVQRTPTATCTANTLAVFVVLASVLAAGCFNAQEWVRARLEAALPAAEAAFSVQTDGLFPKDLLQVARYDDHHHYTWHTVSPASAAAAINRAAPSTQAESAAN